MKSNCFLILFYLIVFSGINNLNAQIKWSDLDYGAHIGTLIYQGDLTPARIGYTKCIRPMIGFNIAKSVSPFVSLRANVDFGSILANDAKYSSPSWKQLRNFNFSTSVTELSLHGIYNFQGENDENNFSRLQAYIFGGAGISFLKIKRDFSKFNRTVFDAKSPVAIGLALDSVHKLPGIIPVIPMGAGLKYFINKSWSLTSEFTYRLLFTDYLDGFKYAADRNKNDSYYGLALGIVYRPSINKYRCPILKN